MKKCPYCAEDIQDAAIVCKHCGRELAPAAATPAVPPAKKSSGALALIVWAVIGVLVLFALSALFGGDSDEKSEQKKTLDVKVAWNDTVVQVTNVSAPTGWEIVLYINGTPPFAYKATSNVPAPGETVRVPLREFVNRSGDRFNPTTQAVTDAWVGGSGYDYQQFKKR